MLQIRLTIFSTILLIGYYATLATFYFYVERRVNDIFSFMDCMSAVGCHHFELLAIRAIGKDEVLVKAYDRLR